VLMGIVAVVGVHGAATRSSQRLTGGLHDVHGCIATGEAMHTGLFMPGFLRALSWWSANAARLGGLACLTGEEAGHGRANSCSTMAFP
jgi:hypothetical protein